MTILSLDKLKNSQAAFRTLKTGLITSALYLPFSGIASATDDGSTDSDDADHSAKLDTLLSGISENMDSLIEFISSSAGIIIVGVAIYAGLKLMKSLLGYGKGTGISS